MELCCMRDRGNTMPYTQEDFPLVKVRWCLCLVCALLMTLR